MSRLALDLLAENVILVAVGWAFLYGVGLGTARRGDLRLIGLSYLVGWALLSSLLSFALMLGIPLVLPTVVVVAGLTIAASVVLRRHPPEPPEPRAKEGVAERVVTAFAVAIIAVALASALVTALKSEWDPNLDLLTAWLPRAHLIFLSHQFDASQWATFLDPWYPPLAPTSYATTFAFVGGFHPSVLSVQQALLGVAFILSVATILDRFAPRWITFPSLALLVTAPWFWWRLTSLLPDQTLAYLVAAAGLTSLLWLYERRNAWLALALVFLVATTLVKLEGLAFAGILAVVVAATGLVVHRRQGLPALILLLGPLAIVPWRLWLSANNIAATNSQLNGSQSLSPSFLAHRIHRLTYAIRYMLDAPWRQDYRTAVIIVLAIAVTLVVVRQIPAVTVALAIWLTLSFFALASSYWTAQIDLQFYVATSASRVGGVLIVAAATATPLLLGLALRSRR
ncbi:MAG TPA: hypothetical protein VH063_02665 [Gaiellaceae bacterium]|jgi:hypothetical protein|nr:hypothetical protein [Gaiellaceae bacterium]